jgi:sugar lactone lactonase YvrE
LKFAVGTTSNPVTVSGVAGPGFANGTFNTAKFSSPGGIAVDSFGNIFVADTGNAAIREISGGQVTTLVGTGAQNAVITTLSPALVSPQGIVVDASGNIYFSDSSTNTVYKYIP